MNSPRKPPTIAQLAESALDNLWDGKRDLKYYIRTAQGYRQAANESISANDLENAFVMFAKAATLVLEKIPTHPQFESHLTPNQRHNLSMNGQEILEQMGDIKPVLIERLAEWHKKYGTVEPDNRDVVVHWSDPRHPSPQPGIPMADGERMVAAELQKWQDFKAHNALEDEKDRQHINENAERMKADALASAQKAAITDDIERARYLRQQEEMRLREQDIVRRRESKKHQQEGIARRQQEADEAAQSVRQTIAANNPGAVMTPVPSINYPTTATGPRPPSNSNGYPPSQPPPGNNLPRPAFSRPSSFHEPQRLPFETPARYEGDSTDSESVHIGFPHPGRHRHPIEYPRTPTRAPPARSPSYPPPITTTSPPPSQGVRINYPQLMSQHQKRQGYHPSANSMFISPEDVARLSNASYSNQLIPKPTHPTLSPMPYGMPGPPHTPSAISHPPQVQAQPSYQYSFYPGPSRPAPQVPQQVQSVPAPAPTQAHPPQHRSDHQQQQQQQQPQPKPKVLRRTKDGLRQVNMPRDCLPRFLTIAKANTNLNLETCGLLLGKDRGTKYVVTTLLIPKQHATSDTCTMDEEELVLQFTEERGLITLGWIHTHPSQSCFMSSVDLHTHSAFQCMLPESFAVVCAPKSNPHFGIFRLTDPPGLKTILECQVKEAFHPHPDLPIYTDADKGHVQMKDMQLEIVDLR